MSTIVKPPLSPTTDMMELLRARVGLPAGDTSKDAQIVQALTLAYEWLETYLNRCLVPGTYIETFTHLVGYTLSLSAFPVSVVNSVENENAQPVTYYHLDYGNGILHFDGFARAHQLTINYTMDTPPAALMVAILAVFDLLWASLFGSGSAVAGGVIKSIASDGARVEFAVESSSGSSGAIDPITGLPMSVLGLLHIFRRELC